MYQVLNEMPESPTNINPSISVVFDYIVARALAKAPENRYQSARKMANDLRNIKTLSTTPPFASTALSWGKSGTDGSSGVRMNASPIPVVSRWSHRKMRAGFIAAAILITASILFIIVSRESAVTTVPTVTDKKLTVPQATLATTRKLPPHLATENKVPDAQSSVTTPTKVTLGFAILPWGEIFIDGKSQGASPPLRKIRISPGKHQIEIKNTEFPAYNQTVALEAGEKNLIKHKFK